MRIRQILPLALIAVAVSVFLAFDASQTPSGQEAAQRQAAQNATGDLEEFRARLVTYYADLADMYDYVLEAGGPASIGEGLTEAQLLIPDFRDEDLGVLRDVISQNPTWWDIPTVMRLSFEPEARGREALSSALGTSTASLMSHSCPSGTSQTALDLAEAAALVSEAINDAINDGLTVVIAGEGTTVPSPAKIISSIAFFALQTTYIVLRQTNDAATACEAANDQAILHDVVAPEVLIDRINLQVIALPGPREFLVTADEDGLPVDVEFIAVQYSRGDDPISFVDVLANTAVTMIRPGLHHVVISASRGSPVIDPPPNIAEFQVKHDHGDYADFGITVFHQVHDDNVGAGH